MTVGGALILYAAVVGLAGPAAVRRARWLERAPRPGAAAVLAAAWSVPVALLLAGVTLALPASALTMDLGRLIGACLTRLQAAYGTPRGTVVVTAGQSLSLVTAARLVWAGARVTRRRHTHLRRHRLLLDLAGQDRPDLPAVVLDSPRATAYSLAGRRPAVVVSRGALELLSTPQLAAVLAHENAHLRARHHRWQLAAALAAAALPVVPLLREAPAQVGRLLEMDADERAADQHEPKVLASALVAVTSRAERPAPGDAGRSGTTETLARAGTDAAARIHRLLRPPAGLSRPRRALTWAAVVALVVTPLILATAPALVAFG